VPRTLSVDEAARMLAEEDVSRERFVEIYAAALRGALPSAEVKVVGELELTITKGDVSLRSFADNLWLQYRSGDFAMDSLLSRHIDSAVESLAIAEAAEPSFDRGVVVPIVRSAEGFGWGGSPEAPDLAADHLVGDLWLFYAIDTPTSIRYAHWEELLALTGLEQDAIRPLALDNLMAILPAPEVVQLGDAPLFMITAGGDYEASLLLVDALWSAQASKVEGDLVVAVPTRDVVLFTGSASPGGLEVLRRVVDWLFGESYSVSEDLYVRRGTSWEVMDG